MELKNNQEQIICVSALGDSIDAEVDPRFGRCQYFLIIKIKGDKITDSRAIKNTGLEQGHGAGVNAAEIVGESGANAVISGNFGPKAAAILEQLGIKTYSGSGNVKDAIKRYLKNL